MCAAMDFGSGNSCAYYDPTPVCFRTTPCSQRPKPCGCTNNQQICPPDRWNLHAIPYFKLYPNYPCYKRDIRISSRYQIYNRWKLRHDL